MSKYFTVRHPLKITMGDQCHTFFVRELSYSRFLEITGSCADEPLEDRRGMLILEKFVTEAVEEEDGSKSYDKESWKDELRTVRNQIADAVLDAQGLDLKSKREQEPLTEEEAEGNVLPSKRFGANSQSSSAAQSESFKAA